MEDIRANENPKSIRETLERDRIGHNGVLQRSLLQFSQHLENSRKILLI